MKMTPIERFERKFVVAPSGHWVWIATTSSQGYGIMARKYAHRLSYEFYVGPIPEGLVIDHLCRVRNCVNPAHLQPVTQGTNVNRGASGRSLAATNRKRAKARTHCPHGHEYTKENTKYETKRTGSIQRRCITCLYEQRISRQASASSR